jgi:hypothetical protein
MRSVCSEPPPQSACSILSSRMVAASQRGEVLHFFAQPRSDGLQNPQALVAAPSSAFETNKPDRQLRTGFYLKPGQGVNARSTVEVYFHPSETANRIQSALGTSSGKVPMNLAIFPRTKSHQRRGTPRLEASRKRLKEARVHLLL